MLVVGDWPKRPIFYPLPVEYVSEQTIICEYTGTDLRTGPRNVTFYNESIHLLIQNLKKSLPIRQIVVPFSWSLPASR